VVSRCHRDPATSLLYKYQYYEFRGCQLMRTEEQGVYCTTICVSSACVAFWIREREREYKRVAGRSPYLILVLCVGVLSGNIPLGRKDTVSGSLHFTPIFNSAVNNKIMSPRGLQIENKGGIPPYYSC
jgi:hypothetical protein